jgi:hypothetical protein
VTEVPIALMKLQVSGGNVSFVRFHPFLLCSLLIVIVANIKDDTATLTSVGVCRNSVVILNGEQVDVSNKSRERFVWLIHMFI